MCCVTFLNLAMKVVSNEGRGDFHDVNIFQSFRVCHGVEMANQPAFLRGGLHCVQHPRRLPMQCRFSVEASEMLEDVEGFIA